MNWSLKKVGLILLVACIAFGLWADEAIFIADGDIGTLRLYDRDGGVLDTLIAVTDEIGEGWILHNPESDLLIITPLGAINLYQDSILITSSLSPLAIELYLVTGQATFNAWGIQGGTLTIRTPATVYTMHEEAEILVITDDVEESVTTFHGSIESQNLITGAVTGIEPSEKLLMRDMQRKASEIQSGYYYTYGTFITAEAASFTAEILMSEPPSSLVAEALPIAEPLSLDEGLVLIPAKPTTLLVARVAPAVAAVPASLTVLAQAPVQLPPAPGLEVSEIVADATLPPSPSLAVQAIEPAIAIPGPPSLTVKEIQRVITVPPSPTLEVQALTADVVVPPTPSLRLKSIVVESPSTPVSTIVANPIPIAVPTVMVSEIRQQESPTPSLETDQEEPSLVVEPAEETPPPARGTLSSSEEQSRREGSIGVITGYEFTWDGTESDELAHRLFIKPYFSKGPFAVTLSAAISTENFSSYSNTILPVPSGTLELTSYVLSYFEHMRIGYETSAFYLLLDNQRAIRSDLSTFFAPHFHSTGKLILQNKISVGPFSLTSTFDDLLFGGLLDGKSQWASSIFEYTATNNYPFTLAIGTLMEIETGPGALSLYPLISTKLPIINSRKTRLDGLIQAQGYLPVYPTVAWDEFVDTSLTYFFPNYLLSGGLALQKGDFNAKILATLNRGNNRNYLINDFASLGMHGYDATFDLLAELGWESNWLGSSLVWNVPFASGFQRARLTGDPSTGADYSHFSLESTIGQLRLGLGIQQLGVIDTITGLFSGDTPFLDLLAGPYASSFLSASYTITPFTFTAMARYPIKNTSFTAPKVSVMATFDLNRKGF